MSEGPGSPLPGEGEGPLQSTVKCPTPHLGPLPFLEGKCETRRVERSANPVCYNRKRRSVRISLFEAFISWAIVGTCGLRVCGSLHPGGNVRAIYTIEPTANVTVINGDGAVFIHGSNTNEMRVQAIKRAYTRERLKQIAVNVSIQPGSISINTKFPPKPKWTLFDRSGTVDYTIVVPATANLARLELGAGEVVVDGMRSQRMHARLGSGRMFAHNCIGNIALTLDRGTLTLAYDWWEPAKLSIQANIAYGNAWAFFPTDIVCHLVAETEHGKIGNDFEEVAQRGTKEITKADILIQGGGDAAVTMRAKEGDIKIVKASL